MNVADAKITMTLSDHDSKVSVSKGQRRQERNEPTFDSVVMMILGRVEQ